MFGENFADLGRLKTLLQADKNENGAPVTDTPVFRATDAFNGSIADVNLSYQNTLPFVKGGSWKRVVDIREGQMIAVKGANDKPVYERVTAINRLPAEQVWDIEVEGTHNFVGNDIIAHNTAIFNGNVGIGTSTPAHTLEVVGILARSGL